MNNQPVLARLITRTAGDFGFLFVNFIIAVAAFVIGVTAFSAGVGTLVIAVGLPVLAVCLMLAGEFGRFVRMLLAGRGIVIEPPVTRRFGPGFGGLLRRLTDGQAWRALVHILVNFVVSIISFVIGTVWFVAAPGGLLYGWWSRWLPANGGHDGLAYLLGYPGHFADTLVNTVLGFLLLITAPWVLRGLVRMHAGIALALLSGPQPAIAPQTPFTAYAPSAR